MENQNQSTMTTREVHEAVKAFFGNYDYPLLNTFVFAWESDFFAISKSGYSVEVEVKISKADFKKDFTHKGDKHELFKRHKEFAFIRSTYPTFEHGMKDDDGKWFQPPCTKISWTKPCESLPNKFFYACPEGLIAPGEVPAYAGLIYTTPFGSTIVKQAPFLHKNKKCFDSILLGKYYHRSNEVCQMLQYFRRRSNLTDHQDQELKKIIDRLH